MSFLTTVISIFLLIRLASGLQSTVQLQLPKEQEVFFNKTSLIRLIPSNFHNQIGLSFRTCSSGGLIVQNTERNTISLDVLPEGVFLYVRPLSNKEYETKINGQFLDNSWHNVNIIYLPGKNITLTVDDFLEMVANVSYNVELLNPDLTLLDTTLPLTLGESFTGCMIEGPSLTLNSTSNDIVNVLWGPCPLSPGPCSLCKKGSIPCQNNARCEEDKAGNAVCVCEPGYTGEYPNCTIITSCIDIDSTCADGTACASSSNNMSFNCTCPAGFTGKLCQTFDECQLNPCQNNGTCKKTGNGFECTCAPGYTGQMCEADIDECQLGICRNGHCVNSVGGYQCFCIPGFTGDYCDLDVDECLSAPCLNNATCINGLNRYTCNCRAGYTGKNCQIDINECESNPCLHGGTCIDRVASVECKCPTGYSGNLCEINIDDCKSAPCLNNGTCVDKVNDYQCFCDNTGFIGVNCEINIDDCAKQPCVNGGTCRDLVKDYNCECFPGYTGKNCQIDINECESNPCQYGSTCLQKSNASLYSLIDSPIALPSVFYQEFSYANATGYACICVPGVTGTNCELDIKECASNPCIYGTCKDEIGKYVCECNDGYNGTHCETEINECEAKPCVHGTCKDEIANYTCDCLPKYGGKNCSVELIGCQKESACLNNGTCKPYLIDETEHRFNCSCPSGFHGAICEKITTMSLNGDAYIVVNTTRDEGYDISFRFQTTLSNGLLALGKGSTYYILELVNGRLNLHSSLLNKWEGVFIGSQLNNATWHKVFVNINSSHVVLSADEEQTIYPVSLNEGGYSNWTSFPTTFVGGSVANLRNLAHGPHAFIGCTENIVINGQWVIPGETNNKFIEMSKIEVGCQRRDQCKTDSCNGVGQCTDLWKNFSCTCQRPYLGNQCEYNVTAATFGHENITNSLVTVSVAPQARKAIRNIVDISMFIRTRQSKGAIFYLGSLPGSVMLNEETYIGADLNDGELLVRIQFHNTTESYTVGGVKLNDGQNHLIQVIRNVTLVQVKINGTEYFRKTIGSSAPLDAQVLYLGGFPVQANENESLTADTVLIDALKNVKDPPLNNKIDVTTNARYTRQTADKFENIPNFKGIIQDVQISNGSLRMAVEFFPLKPLNIPKLLGNVSFDPNTVLEGVLSDDACASNPCFNDGNCTVTWNDFTCQCSRGYKGKQCQDMEFCETRGCPAGGECRNLPHGYECVSNITMSGLVRNASLQYSFVHNEKTSTLPSLHSIDLIYRSRTGGTLLYLCNKLEYIQEKHLYFFVFVFNDTVTVAWKLSPQAKEMYHSINKEPADGEWTTVNIKIENNKIIGSFPGVENESGQVFSSSNFSSAAWYHLVHSGKIYIGGSDNIVREVLLSHKNNYQIEGDFINTVESPTDIIPKNYGELSILQSLSAKNPSGIYYKGCIGEIRINGILLPYFTETRLNGTHNDTQHFVLEDVDFKNIDYGCYLCFPDDCKYGGKCANRTASYHCDCPIGFDGEDCSHDVDECIENKCQHGATCVDGIGNYTCQCTIGWSGWLCDNDINECMSQPCKNNGTCIDYLGYYKCNCTDEFMGKNCEQVKQVTCDNNPCKNGASCSNRRNENTGDNFTCTCSEGFIGTYCDEKFCSATPCQNEGLCVIKQKGPMCECHKGFQGMYCEENVNDCQILSDGSQPCLHGGLCIDRIASYLCNCTSTGYKGERCDIDIDECIEEIIEICGQRGKCKNLQGSYKCECDDNVCGYHCDLYDPCMEMPCQNGGTCQEKCTDEPNYECICQPNYVGKNCTELQLYSVNRVVDIALIVGPIAIILLLALVISVVMFFMMARNKRATRGTYSPSSQEYCNPRVELDNVMKPPPEERLI